MRVRRRGSSSAIPTRVRPKVGAMPVPAVNYFELTFDAEAGGACHLSGDRYLTTSPGALKHDVTILTKTQ